MGSLSQLQQIGLGFTGLSAVNSGVAGFGEYESGQQQKKADDYNASVTLQQMQDQMQTSEAKYSNLIGKQATSFARAGVDIASGSPLLAMLHTAAQKGTEEESEYQAGTEEAALQRYYGKVAAFSGTIGGISTFISGLSKAGLSAGSILGPSSAYPGGTIPTLPPSMAP
jgi:hypothetical protein